MSRYRAIAEYYDPQNERLAWLQRDVGFFLRQLPRRPLEVLELACGTGRAAIPIAQAGHRVVGIDYAKDLLAIARRKRDVVGLGERELKLVCADVRKFDLRRRFDAVAIVFNTFLLFTTLMQQDMVLQKARRHLKPGGLFWLDIFQPNLELLARDVSKGMHPFMFYVPSLKRTVYMDCDVRRDPSRQVQQITYNYRWFDGTGREHHERERFDLTFIFPRELEILLERNGFRIEKLVGDYDGEPLDADSPRMIAACRIA